MTDVWLRVAVVGAALLVSGAIVVWMRRRAALRMEHPVDATGFEPGVYFFSSPSCSSCASARRKLEARLGDDYVELSWEESPEVFTDLQIDRVPAVMIVRSHGTARLFAGQPERALRRV